MLNIKRMLHDMKSLIKKDSYFQNINLELHLCPDNEGFLLLFP